MFAKRRLNRRRTGVGTEASVVRGRGVMGKATKDEGKEDTGKE